MNEIVASYWGSDFARGLMAGLILAWVFAVFFFPSKINRWMTFAVGAFALIQILRGNTNFFVTQFVGALVVFFVNELMLRLMPRIIKIFKEFLDFSAKRRKR